MLLEVLQSSHSPEHSSMTTLSCKRVWWNCHHSGKSQALSNFYCHEQRRSEEQTVTSLWQQKEKRKSQIQNNKICKETLIKRQKFLIKKKVTQRDHFGVLPIHKNNRMILPYLREKLNHTRWCLSHNMCSGVIPGRDQGLTLLGKILKPCTIFPVQILPY